MTTKEKAVELTEKFRKPTTDCHGHSWLESQRKKCALICVDEIIKELLSVEFNYNLDFKSDLIQYWNDVKIEIKALS